MNHLLVKVARDRGEYFAEKIYAATSGLLNSDNTLIRIAVSQAEVKYSSYLAIRTIYENMK